MYWKIIPRGPRDLPRAGFCTPRSERLPEGKAPPDLAISRGKSLVQRKYFLTHPSTRQCLDTIQWLVHARMVRRCHSSASCDSNEPASQLAGFTSVVTLPVIILIFTIILNWYYWSPKPQCSYVQLEVHPLSGKLLLFYSIEYIFTYFVYSMDLTKV